MIRTIRVVLFDFGGTLDANGLHWRERFARIYVEEGVTVAQEVFDRAFYDSDDNLSRRFDLKKADLSETVRLQVGCVLDALGLSRASYQDIITQRFINESRDELRRNRGLLDRLRRRFRLGIVSNFYGNMDAILKGEDLDGLFDAVADSEQVGAAKPDEKLFLFATRKLGVEPHEAMMIGDSVPRDMRGAEALGMPHAWVRGERSASEACCPRAPVLHALSDIAPLLLPEEIAA